MSETQNNLVETENEFEIEDSYETPTIPDAEYEPGDNTLDEIMQKFGGSPDDWDLSHQESGSMRFSGREMVDAKGISLTQIIKQSGSVEQIAMHMGLLATWEANPSKVQLIEFMQDGRLSVTALKLEAGGMIDSKTWTREISEEVPILSFEDLRGNQIVDEDGADGSEVAVLSEDDVIIDLDQHLAAAEMTEVAFEEERLDNTNVDLNNLESGQEVVVSFEPQGNSSGLPPSSNSVVEILDDIDDLDLRQKVA